MREERVKNGDLPQRLPVPVTNYSDGREAIAKLKGKI